MWTQHKDGKTVDFEQELMENIPGINFSGLKNSVKIHNILNSKGGGFFSVMSCQKKIIKSGYRAKLEGMSLKKPEDFKLSSEVLEKIKVGDYVIAILGLSNPKMKSKSVMIYEKIK